MLVVVVLFAAFGGFLYGYDLGLISGALSYIRDDFNTSEIMEEAIVGAAKVGAVLGTFLGGALMLHYGRRKAIALDSFFYVVGPVCMAFASHASILLIGRFLVGVGIGMSAVVAPAYLGEIAPAHLRGRIVESYEILLCFGMLASVAMDVAFGHLPHNWRWMVGSPSVLGLVLAAGLYVLPESPRWLVVSGRLDEALAVIHKIYLSVGLQNDEVEQELMELWSNVEKEKAAKQERTAARQAAGKDVGRRSESRGDEERLLLHAAGGGHPAGDRLPADSVAWPKGQGSVGGHDTRDGEAEQNGSAGPAGAGEPESGGPTGREQEAAQQATLDARDDSDGRAAVASAGTTDADVDRGGSAEEAQAGVDEAGVGLAEDMQEGSIEPKLYRLLSTVPQARPSCIGQMPIKSMGLSPIRTRSWKDDDASFTDSDAPASQQRSGALHKALASAGEAARHLADALDLAGYWRTQKEVVMDVWAVLRGPERRAVRLALVIAFLDQGMASTAIVNYAPQVLERVGVQGHGMATALSACIPASKVAGVVVSLLYVDSAGRRPLMVWGGAGCAAALLLMALANHLRSSAFILVAMCSFLFAFSASYAAVFWVLCSEMFSMSIKASASSAAMAVLFAAGAAANFVFLSLYSWLQSGAFLVFAAIAGFGTLYVHLNLPETKGLSLTEVQAKLAGKALQLDGRGADAGATQAGDDTPPAASSRRSWLSNAFEQVRHKFSTASYSYVKFIEL
ncbi:MFS general substrate transporter [Coccomyxa subellipsoidea C-169]|uniref:MFS general substrate transporter n=1 Tax=Coccomyxa subellipsoidea (strain C-169) TaxID=574566 RepID=I0YRA7_COCSC|nr:MFS general substrate transporter [Coccomyxa subellipsoidea C-169]EIE20926.1 MFS general substrate transporter [Coccomyxa subellipsoidea C-169]|eukprot:XP_005645470.1 MFS general substrate transporter [Coccomyxa subellipsoidea C-169]